MKGTFQRKYLGIPYALYLLVFVIMPLIVIVKYAFTDASGRPGIGNFINFFTDPNTLGTLMYSLFLAFATTMICLLIAYPAAYCLAMSRISSKSAILMLMIMPMWINFTLRITALKELLTMIEGNLALHPFANSVIGMTYDFLPFMILPIYNQISRIDKSLLEAGCRDSVLDLAFGGRDAAGYYHLPGVLSRKKQVIPPLTEAFKKME